jgi:hypothetical protein
MDSLHPELQDAACALLNAVPLSIGYSILERYCQGRRRRGWQNRKGDSNPRALLCQFLPQQGGIARERDSRIQVHQASAHELGDLAVEILHAIGLAALDCVE